ncbi:MAG TPA: hypothetical protein VKA00_05305 [Trueperaceae bacterium]|nr:hypothetical protein [Trueperaceae bacterium]
MRRFALALPALTLLFLAACAPSSSPEVKIQQLTKPLSYYPHQTGAHWEYLPDGAKIDDPRVTEDVDGPTVVNGQVWIGWHLKGRGLDVTRYRQYRDDGVYLGRENKLGTIINFDPAMKEFPKEGTLRVGSTWAGDTTVTVNATQGGDQSKAQSKTLQVHYVYTVVDKRQVTLAAGSFEIFVVSFTTRTMDANGDVASELTQQYWFSPYVGIIRDENGNVLVASNVLKAPSSKQGSDASSSGGNAGP